MDYHSLTYYYHNLYDHKSPFIYQRRVGWGPQARDLPAADFGFGGGSSDPYVVVKIGTTSFTSVKRVKTLNPQWGRLGGWVL